MMDRAAASSTRAERLALVALAALTLTTYPFAALIVDSGRDLGWAWSIAQGHEWPRYGPSLNGLWQPGPVWFYLLALALKIGGSVGAATLAVGVLAALKIPLAYGLGRSFARLQARHRDTAPAAGLMLAAAVALPSWHSLDQLVLSHTMLVQGTVLATLWLALIAWRDRNRATLIGASLMLGLAIHAHPTALVAAPALACAAWRQRRVPNVLATACATLLAFGLPFAPALLAEASAGWPQWQASTGYFGQSDYLSRLARAPAVAVGASRGGIEFVQTFLLGRWPLFAALAGIALGLLYAGAALGLGLALLRRDAHAWVVSGFAALAWTFVLLLRDSTPVWMIYACAPFDAALLALGWQSWWRGRAPRAMGLALAAMATMLGAGLLLDRISVARSGVQWFPSAALGDIAQPLQRDPPIRFWLPSYAHDTLAARLCADSSPTALHGDLAAALHFGQGVAVALRCAVEHHVHLGGAAARQLAGLPTRIAAELQLQGETTDWGYTLFKDISAVYPDQGLRVQAHTRYLMDDYRARIATTTPTRIALDAPCTARDVLAVTNLLPGLNVPFALTARDAAALPMPAAETLASRYFACPPEGRFRLELEVLDPQAADVFVLRAD